MPVAPSPPWKLLPRPLPSKPATVPCPSTAPAAGPGPKASPVGVHPPKPVPSKSCTTSPVGGV